MYRDLDEVAHDHLVEAVGVNHAITAVANHPGDDNVRRLRAAIVALTNAAKGLDSADLEDKGADNGKPEPEESETENADDDADAGDDETPRSSER